MNGGIRNMKIPFDGDSTRRADEKYLETWLSLYKSVSSTEVGL